MPIKERKESDLAARREAVSIVHAMKHGVDMSDTLLTTQRDAELLEEFCVDNPADAYIVRNAVDFRNKVREIVDRIILAGEVIEVSDDGEEGEAEEDLIAPSASPEASASVQSEEESTVSET